MCLPVWNILKSRLYLLQKLTFYGCTYFVGCFSILVEWTTDFDYKTLNKPLDHHHLHHTTCKQPDTQRQRSSKPELCPPVASALSSLLPSIPHLRHAEKKNGYVPDEHLHSSGRDVTLDGAPRLLQAEDLTDGQRAAFVRNHVADVDLLRWPVDRLLLQALFRLTFYASHPQ